MDNQTLFKELVYKVIDTAYCDYHSYEPRVVLWFYEDNRNTRDREKTSGKVMLAFDHKNSTTDTPEKLALLVMQKICDATELAFGYPCQVTYVYGIATYKSNQQIVETFKELTNGN